MKDISNEVVCVAMINLLRRQRHDFLNHVQVVHAYLQMGKDEKALQYLDNAVEKINAIDFSTLVRDCPDDCIHKRKHD